MARLSEMYRPSLALLTDLYQLTMAYGFWKHRRLDEEAVFHLTFRQNPFGGGYTLVAGLDHVIDLVSGLRLEEADLAYLRGLLGNDGRPLFESAFLDFLKELRFTIDIDAMPEGTVAFAHEPLVRVKGPILQCQIVESALLNIINFQSLIATKAARVCRAAGNEPVLEFGLRRAQGIDGALAASRAAYIGGCAATSNVLAGRLLGIPVRGTHAHSWVMSFDSEMEAFDAYAEAMPNNCVFLVDTYDTLEGVQRAIAVGRRLRERGHELAGIRLDSGDLADLSIRARRMLDEAGFPKAAIIASNDLDERIIESLKTQGAKISIWGVGTRLVTAYDQPALGGVFKLSAIREPGGEWEPRVKVSEQTIKTSTPGIVQVRRFRVGVRSAADMIYEESLGAHADSPIVSPVDPTRRFTVPPGAGHDDLLVPVMRNGQPVSASPSLDVIRRRAREQLASFEPRILRFLNPHEYPVGLDDRLHALKTDLILRAREGVAHPKGGGHEDRSPQTPPSPDRFSKANRVSGTGQSD